MVNIIELDKEKMNAVRELASVGVKISDAKNALSKLKEEEKTYLDEREKATVAKIQAVLDDSADLLKSAHGNYEQIHGLCQTISAFCDFLIEAQGEFHGLLEAFVEHREGWDKEFERQNAELAEARRGIAVERSFLENAKKDVEKAQEKLKEDRIKIADDRGTIDRAIKRLSEGRI